MYNNICRFLCASLNWAENQRKNEWQFENCVNLKSWKIVRNQNESKNKRSFLMVKRKPYQEYNLNPRDPVHSSDGEDEKEDETDDAK